MTQDNDNLPRPRLLVYMPGREFLLPYFERQFPHHEVVTDLDAADIRSAVMVSSTDIYDVTDGQLHDENTPLRTDSADASAERRFADACRRLSLEPLVLRCAEIVATGMDGFAMRLVRGMARMTMFKIADNDARISLVHGVDVARAADCLLDKGVSGTFNLTDGTETPLNELLDALSVRLSDKRVYTIKPRWARWLYGKTYYTQLTRTLTFSNDKISTIISFTPNKVTKYLTSHVYDESSL